MTKRPFAYAAAALLAVYLLISYNGLVRSDETVQQSYAQVQNVMQRQAELIPNLVETVKAYAAHENKTLVGVSEARAKVSAIAKLDPDKLASDPALQKQLIEAQQSMQQSIMNLNAVREAYPQLQANENFKSLMVELAGSQNRITVERRKNQLAVQDYNERVRVLPRSIIASATGFRPKPYFAASEAAQTAPTVKF